MATPTTGGPYAEGVQEDKWQGLHAPVLRQKVYEPSTFVNAADLTALPDSELRRPAEEAMDLNEVGMRSTARKWGGWVRGNGVEA